MIHFISGLFGGADIWNPYLEIGDCRVYDLENLPTDVTEEDIVVGYSMGGRIATKLAIDLKFNIKRLILLSSHPGLEEQDKPNRKAWEDQIIQKMDTLGEDDFLKFWDTLDLFNQSQVNKKFPRELFKAHRNYFDSYRLSEQENYLPKMIEHKNKISFIYGKYDEKYSSIAKQLTSSSIRCIEVVSDHRVYLRPDSLIPILKRELVL